MPGHPDEDFRRVASPFEGELSRLRAFEESDIPRLNQMFNDPDVLQFLAINFPEPLAGTREWWDRSRRDERAETFAIETLAGELIGVCSLEGISGPTRSAGLGIWLGKSYWDKGYGTDATRTLCRLGFREMNLQRIGLAVYEGNERGKRVYEKIGFKEEGRRRRAHFIGGRYIDVIVMGLLVEDLIED